MSRETPVCFELKKKILSIKARAARQANRPIVVLLTTLCARPLQLQPPL